MSAIQPAWGTSSTTIESDPSVRSWSDRYEDEDWRSRPGRMGERERERAVDALFDLMQTGFREMGGGLP